MVVWFKFFHLLAVVLFLGNIITGLFWHIHAAKTRDPKLLAHTMAGIIRSDRWFTLPGVLAIIVFGFGGAGMRGYPILRTDWILWTIILFSISGIAFMWKVAPLQKKMLKAATQGASGTFDWEGYHRLARQWEIWGALALVTPLAGMALMVFKPAF